MIHAIFTFILLIILLGLVLVHYSLKYIQTKRNEIRSAKHIRILTGSIFLSLIILTYLLGYNLYENYDKPQDWVSVVSINLSIVVWFVVLYFYYYSFKFKYKYQIVMEYPSRWKSRGTIKLGKIVFKNKVKHSFNLSVEDLAQHMFITGITGTGKSNFLQNFLIEFTKHHPDIPFLITEFKGEYHHLQDRIGDLLILKPGENFSLNIFDPQAVNYQIHAERVFKIFESGGLLENIDYSPQMEAVFVEILRTVIGNPKFRSWKGFERISKQYLRDHKDLTYKKSVIAVQNRIRRYYVGTLKQIFDTKSSVTVQDLFSHKVLLDLHPIIKLGGEKEDALFFLNMVLKYLWDRNIVLGSRDYAGIRHVTIIEDAQYFAPQELSARTKLTSYIEDIALLLRGTGECLITLATRPNISKEILSNAGVLVCFQLHMQKDLMKQLLNLQEWQEKYLSELKKGQCVVRVNSVEKPFALQCDYVKRHWLSDEQIRKNNRRIIESKINKVEQKIEKKMEEIKVKNPELIQEIENSNPSTEKKSFDQMLREKRAFCKLCKAEIEVNSDYCAHCKVELEKEDKEIYELRDLMDKFHDMHSK